MAKYRSKQLNTHNSAHLYVRPPRYEDRGAISELEMFHNGGQKDSLNSWAWDKEAIKELAEWARRAAPLFHSDKAGEVEDFVARNGAKAQLAGDEDGGAGYRRINFASNNQAGWWWTSKALLELAVWLETRILPRMV